MDETRTYTCNGQTYTCERDMLLALLDTFRAGESLGAELLRLWAAACQLATVRGGLRTIIERESWHARVLAQRLQELGGQCQAETPVSVREHSLQRFGSAAVSDLDKLRELAGYVSGPSDPLAALRRAVLQVEDDQESRALLLTMLDDEEASARWLRETCQALAGPTAGSTSSV